MKEPEKKYLTIELGEWYYHNQILQKDVKMPKSLPFQPLKKKRLYEEVADQIKQSIFDGRLQPGDKLPPERELCGIFNVGRPTIREALRTLSVMGLVEVNHGLRGSVIKECDITQYLEAIREHLSWLIKVDDKTVEHLAEVRKYIELGIAHSVAQKATKKEMQKLEQLIKKMEACRNDIHAYFPIAVEFHRELAMASQNKVFYLIWGIFHDILLKGYVPLLEEMFPEGPSKLLEANKILLQAIQSKDTNAINEAMEFHANQEKFSVSQSNIATKGHSMKKGGIVKRKPLMISKGGEDSPSWM